MLSGLDRAGIAHAGEGNILSEALKPPLNPAVLRYRLE